MQRYFDVVQNRQGTAVVGATVTVYDANGSLATLYSSNSGTAPSSNPVYTNSDGEYAFYAANGTYTIQIAATGYAGETKPGVVLFDPIGISVIPTLYGSRFCAGTNRFTFDAGVQIGGGDTSYGSYGAMLRTDGSKDWITLMPLPYADNVVDAIEFAVNGGLPGTYSASGSNVLLSATIPSNAQRIILDEAVYQISSVGAGGTSCVVVGTPSASGVFVYAPTRGFGTCSVSGTTVSRVSGDPFISFTASPFVFTINGVAYTVVDATGAPDTYVLATSPGNLTNAFFSWQTTINDQVSTVRVSRLWGANEENVSLYSRYDGYWLHTLYGGSGSYRPLRIGSGEITPGTLAQQIVCQTNGDLTLGWSYGGEAIRILNESNAANRFETVAALTGVPPVWRARGSDTNVGFGLDTQGTGAYTFTSGSFGRTNFKIFGSAGVDYITVDAGTGSVPLAAEGTSANIDIHLISKGSGAVRLGTSVRFGSFTSSVDAAINGYVTIVDDAGNTRKLATIA
jgi:hypothetical protein